MSSMNTSIRTGLSRSFISGGRGGLAFMKHGWAYDLGGVLVRMGADLLMANVGFLLGYIVTILYSAFIRSEMVTSFWIRDRLFFGWMSAFPLFTILCFLTLTATGLSPRTGTTWPGGRSPWRAAPGSPAAGA